MKNAWVIGALCFAFVLGVFAAKMPVPTAEAATMAAPSSGWTLHIDALDHFGSRDASKVAHHWCKGGLAGGILECQIYDSDAPNARLVEIETIVPAAVYKKFPASEQALWHYHRVEIPLVHATLPGMPPAQQKKVVASLLETYGKIWMLWDPAKTQNGWPTGQPSVVILPKH